MRPPVDRARRARPADPVHRTLGVAVLTLLAPGHIQQIFSRSTPGGHLRQLTRFRDYGHTPHGCSGFCSDLRRSADDLGASGTRRVLRLGPG